MKLNDPFGRIAAKHEASYRRMRASLLELGVDTEPKAQEVRANMRRNGIWMATASLLVVGIVGLLATSAFLMVLILAAMFWLWLIPTWITGQRQMRRFIQEEFRSRR